jgi:hypothetical protein
MGRLRSVKIFAIGVVEGCSATPRHSPQPIDGQTTQLKMDVVYGYWVVANDGVLRELILPALPKEAEPLVVLAGKGLLARAGRSSSRSCHFLARCDP